MGAFDMVSDDDPRAQAHAERGLHSGCGRLLSEYSVAELKAEIKKRAEDSKKNKIETRKRLQAEKKAHKLLKQKRFQKYIELKKEFEK